MLNNAPRAPEGSSPEPIQHGKSSQLHSDSAGIKVIDGGSGPAREANHIGTSSDHQQSDSLGYVTSLAFVLFGTGSGWILVNALYLQLPFYQHRFGLATSNRMVLSYNFGSLSVLMFFIAKLILRRCCRRRIYYRPLILLFAMLNLTGLIASSRIGSLAHLMLLTVVGGMLGYLVGFVHQAHILLRYENKCLAAFWTGDALGGALAALLAILQRPDLQEQSRFTSKTFYSILVFLVPFSLASFLLIEKKRLGRLPTIVTARALEGAEDGELDNEEEIFFLSAFNTLDAKSDDTSQPGIGVGHAPSSSEQGSKVTGICCEGLRTRPVDSAVLMLIVFWSQFANWGIGDSIYPYACENALPEEQLKIIDVGAETCAFNASLATVFADVVGASLATVINGPSLQSLAAPAAFYTFVFFLLCFASAIGGFWAKPFGAGVGWYIVSLITVMRILGPYMRNLVNRLIQVRYEPLVWESVNSAFLILGTISNVVGAAVGFLFVDE